MKILDQENISFYKDLKKNLEKRYNKNDNNINNLVKKIIIDVKKNGDKALIKYAKKFDNIKIKKNDLIKKNIKKNEFINEIDKNVLTSFRKAIKNVVKFHKKQIPKNYIHNNSGAKLYSQWKPLDSVGLYIPGGKAVYPSSLIMNVIPAKIAGVKRIVCVTPPCKKINPYILALLYELKIKEIYFIGGAQAIAALAYGTETIKPVNKIFGPGNDFVASAKKHVFGKVGIDLIAGPSEIVVLANSKNNPYWVASDLMAQAEHDINSQSILITDNKNFAKKVLNNIKKLSAKLNKKNTINKSLKNNGIIILIKNIEKSFEIINYIAPEHLHLHIKKNKKFLNNLKNVGSIFIGEYASESFGDYIVGTNHVLPTFGSAKFSSGLGVLDFMKRNSIIEINRLSFNQFAKDVEKMADVEGLEAHKLSVKIRQTK